MAPRPIALTYGPVAPSWRMGYFGEDIVMGTCVEGQNMTVRRIPELRRSFIADVQSDSRYNLI